MEETGFLLIHTTMKQTIAKRMRSPIENRKLTIVKSLGHIALSLYTNILFPPPLNKTNEFSQQLHQIDKRLNAGMVSVFKDYPRNTKKNSSN